MSVALYLTVGVVTFYAIRTMAGPAPHGAFLLTVLLWPVALAFLLSGILWRWR